MQSGRLTLAKPSRRALARWRERTEWPLVGAAVLFLLAYAVPILHRRAPVWERHTFTAVLIVTWVLFGVDYLVRVYLDKDRTKHLGWHVPDFLILVVPIFLSPLRVLRLLMLFRVINRKAAVALQGRVAAYVGGTAALVILCGALAELDAERHAPAHLASQVKITSFGDALWWAVTTVTTVGYGDLFPVTTQGRLVAVGLMFAGIALIGLVTASFASWLIARVRQAEDENRAATAEDLHALRVEVTALRQELGLRSVKAAPPPTKKTG